MAYKRQATREQQTAREAPIHTGRCCDGAFDDIERLSQVLHYAFQPIVNVHTGRCHGVEALLRGYQSLGFDSAVALLDGARQSRRLDELEALLRELAFGAFARLEGLPGARLFLNVDNRSDCQQGLSPEALVEHLARHGLRPEQLVLELSERHDIMQQPSRLELLQACRRHHMRLAIDNFGVGHAGLMRLHDLRPDYLKIDRHFVAGLGGDHRRKLFVAHMASLAHTLGVEVIAEGVENEHEFHACCDIGSDLVQGHLIQHPLTACERLRDVYEHIADLRTTEGRSDDEESRFLSEQISQPPILRPEMLMTDALTMFRDHREHSFFPVIDDDERPLGVLHEQALRLSMYSPFGHALLKRHRVADQMARLVRVIPSAEAGTPLSRLLDLYHQQEDTTAGGEGVFATCEGRYQGLWRAATLIHAIQRRDMHRARDENPLTRLPGNRSIAREVAARLGRRAHPWCLVYFDLDNFKAFNDRYGFRQGDRVLMLFGQLLSAHFADSGCFVGHVGGDDFVLIMDIEDYDIARTRIAALQEDLRQEALQFYDEASRQRGYLDGTDRFGAPRRFPLLAVAAAALCLHPCRRSREESDIEACSALLKCVAKESDSGLGFASLR
ncbi:bifunctional diguanylate cyclase/phosphodiesterase [Kushneria aurantia]|uniref:EAL domain-containing protein n=1 Tax=Kushneria aurantia TaxID=504092 RepID=A0ABV6G130_9GAMM|nr:bifunctional diguanylate cyclase/phosphodiesterase [Kushneria aurantia]